jgi:large conductance mechanosensitive channel
MSVFGEFKKFAMRGNVVDLATGVIIGAAFGAVVGSMVADILMPPIGYVIGGVDFADLKLTLANAVPVGETHPLTQQVVTKEVPAVSINYGNFINALIKFIIQAFAIFMVIKAMNKMVRKEPEPAPAPPPPPPEDVVLLREIRDLLRK